MPNVEANGAEAPIVTKCRSDDGSLKKKKNKKNVLHEP